MRVVELGSADTERFLSLRRRGLSEDPDGFRFAVPDDDALGARAWRERLDRDRVVGVETDRKLVAIGGLSRFVGAKLDHKGLIWGMYVVPEARGTGAADLIIAALLEHAADLVDQLQADRHG